MVYWAEMKFRGPRITVKYKRLRKWIKESIKIWGTLLIVYIYKGKMFFGNPVQNTRNSNIILLYPNRPSFFHSNLRVTVIKLYIISYIKKLILHILYCTILHDISFFKIIIIKNFDFYIIILKNSTYIPLNFIIS